MLQGLQRAAGPFALILLLCGTIPNLAHAIGVASSSRFTVYAPTQRLADKAVGHADAFADEISAEWFGSRSYTPAHRTTITIETDDDRSFARTLAGTREGHLMWLAGSETAVTQHLLRHEVAHAVMLTHFGESMPVWANEGIASRYDNARRHSIRQCELEGFVEIDSWPHLDDLFSKPVRQPWQYAAAVSLTDYLVQLGGRERFVAFVELASDQGHSQALEAYYAIESLDQLEHQWRDYVRGGQELPRQRLTVARASLSARSIR